MFSCIKHIFEYFYKYASNELDTFTLLNMYSKEPRHDKTNMVRLRQAWIQTSLLIHAVWSGSLTNPITSKEIDREQHGSWSDWADEQAGLDPFQLQTHYVGFVVTGLKYIFKIFIEIKA
jgi:hypothetical protein